MEKIYDFLYVANVRRRHDKPLKKPEKEFQQNDRQEHLAHLQYDLGRRQRLPQLGGHGRGLRVGEAVLAPVVGVAGPAQAHRDPDP